MATGKGNSFITDLLKLLFQNTNIANLGDATGVRGSGAAGNLYLSLHTADPGAGGSQTTSEAAYTGYARVAVPRSSGGFTVTAQTVTLAALTSFPQCTAGSPASPEVEAYVAIGRDATGAGEILYRAQLSANINVSIGVTPQITTATGLTES